MSVNDGFSDLALQFKGICTCLNFCEKLDGTPILPFPPFLLKYV